MVAKSKSGMFVRTQKTDFSLFLNISETSRKQKNGGHNYLMLTSAGILKFDKVKNLVLSQKSLNLERLVSFSIINSSRPVNFRKLY